MTRVLPSSGALSRFGPPLVLLGWSGLLLQTLVSGKVRVLVHPRFIPWIALSALLLAAAGIGYAFLFRSFRAEPQGGRIWPFLLLLAPALAAALCAPRSFSAAELARRGALAQGGARLAALARAPAGQAGTAIDFPTLAFAAFYPDPSKPVDGRPIHVVAQFLPGHDGTFKIVRVVLACCANDAMPMYLPVAGTPPAVHAMDWIEIEGVARLAREEGGKWTPRIDLTAARPAAAPGDPYVYAFGAKAASLNP